MIRQKRGFFEPGFIELNTHQVAVVPPITTQHLRPKRFPRRVDRHRHSGFYFHTDRQAGAGWGIILQDRRFLQPISASASPMNGNQIGAEKPVGLAPVDSGAAGKVLPSRVLHHLFLIGRIGKLTSARQTPPAWPIWLSAPCRTTLTPAKIIGSSHSLRHSARTGGDLI